MLLTGVPFYENIRRKMKHIFPEYETACARTDGSDIIALWHADTWKVTFHDTMQLVGQRTCLVLNIQRLTAQVHEESCDVSSLANEDAIKVLLTKFHWSWRHQPWRHEAWRRMLELVQDNTQWIIAGALAVSESQLAQRLKEQNCELDLCRVLSADKAITCLTCGIEPSTCESLNMIQSLIIDVPERHHVTTYPDEDLSVGFTSHAPKLDRNTDSPLRLSSRHDCFLRWIDSANEDGSDLVKLLYGPRRIHWWAPDGSLMLAAPTVAQCHRKYEFGMELLHQARLYGTEGVDKDDALSKEEMDWALHWLKDVYRYKYLTRPGLGDALDDWDTGAREFAPSAKKLIRKDFRSGFRTFLRDTIGDASIAYAIMRHGYRSATSLTRLVQELYKARATNAEQQRRGTDSETPKAELAQAAKKARQMYSHGSRLAFAIEYSKRSYEEFDEWEQEMHRRFHTGALLREMWEANKRHGYGQGAPKSLSMEELAHIGVIKWHASLEQQRA